MRAVPAGDKTHMVVQYITDKVEGLQLDSAKCAALAFVSDTGEFVGGAVVTNFRTGKYGSDCEISCAAETSMAFRPHVCAAVFQYVFEQLKCTRLTAITTKRNKRTRDFLSALGFVLEGNIRRAYDGKRDALIYGLLVEDCRYLAGGLHGEKERAERPDAA